jgi:hypothetical protein
LKECILANRLVILFLTMQNGMLIWTKVHTILDYGCGQGHMLKRSGFKTVDVNETNLKIPNFLLAKFFFVLAGIQKESYRAWF